MSYNLWDSIFTGNDTKINKALYGSFLVRDYNDAATNVASYSPFDAVTGNLSTTLLTTDGWTDPGLISETGVQFNPRYTTVETMAWQSRQAQRTDVTVDEEECTVSFLQADSIIDELVYMLPLGSQPEDGSVGYTLTKPTVPEMQYRQVLVLGVDGSSGDNEYFAILYARALVTKVDKFEFSAKNVVETQLTWTAYPDPYSGFAVRRFREGPAWRNLGGVTSTPSTPVATAAAHGLSASIVFTAPSSSNFPFQYNVLDREPGGSGSGVAVSSSDVSITSIVDDTVTLEITGLTNSDTYDFAVTATGSNGSTSAATAYSNIVTANT